MREGLNAKRDELRKEWGKCEESEVEIGLEVADAEFQKLFDGAVFVGTAVEKAAKGLLCGWRHVHQA